MNPILHRRLMCCLLGFNLFFAVFDIVSASMVTDGRGETIFASIAFCIAFAGAVYNIAIIRRLSSKRPTKPPTHFLTIEEWNYWESIISEYRNTIEELETKLYSQGDYYEPGSVAKRGEQLRENEKS